MRIPLRYLQKKDGTVFPVEVSTGAFFVGGRRKVFAAMRDIGERKQAEVERENLQAQLFQAQKMEAVGRLAGGVAHDFNNQLTVIGVCGQLALATLEEGDPLREYVQEILGAADRSAALTRQLLAFARRQPIAPRVLDLNDTVAGMLKMLGRLIGEDIDLVWMPCSHPWSVNMDPSQIDQILANLVVNARDAIAGVGKVAIETENATLDEADCATHAGFVPGEYVMLAISDDGCGMDDEALERIFEPFFTTKPVGEGTGLGLATVYGIVKQNNGFINVYSEPGKGTIFRIYLPRHSHTAEGTAGEARGPVHAPTGTETVLLVEDESTVLKLATRLLDQLGYKVLAAASPSQALQLAEDYTDEIHLLLTDVVMPEMSGRDLCERLVALRPGIRALFMSGYPANAIAHRGVLGRGIDLLEKPFSIDVLAARVRAVL